MNVDSTHQTEVKPPSRLSETFRALRHRNYQLFFSGQLISLIGTWMDQVAESWLVYRLTGSALLLGTVAFASQIPVFLLAPIGGALADRGADAAQRHAAQFGRIGHNDGLHRSGRMPDGRPIHQRIDGPGFDTMDTTTGRNTPKLQFSGFFPSSDFFATLRRNQAPQACASSR